jgi:hypothetical protein
MLISLSVNFGVIYHLPAVLLSGEIKKEIFMKLLEVKRKMTMFH